MVGLALASWPGVHIPVTLILLFGIGPLEYQYGVRMAVLVFPRWSPQQSHYSSLVVAFRP